MLKQRLEILKPIFWLIDFFLSLLAFSTATLLHFYVFSPHKKKDVIFDPEYWYIFVDFLSPQWPFLIPYAHLSFFFSLSQVFIFEYIGTYQLRHRFYIKNEFISIFKGVILNLFIILALLFFYRITSFSRIVIILIPLFSILFIFFGHRGLWLLIELFYQNIHRLYTVLIIGTGQTAQELIQALSLHRTLGYHILGLIGKKLVKDKPGKNLYMGNFSKLKFILEKHNPSLVIYANKHNTKEIEETIRTCDQKGIDCHIIPALSDLISTRSSIEDMNGIPLLITRNAPLHNTYNQLCKRLFDITFACCIILLTSPLFILIALLIKADRKNRGPVFFRQERVGLNQKHFYLWKFRTMKTQNKAGADKTWGKKRDPRVTGIGSFLRKTSIDELPQFWNVLLGNMSIIGPRPERPFFVEKFKNSYKLYMRRHAVKSGITGWAQVLGLRGNTSIRKRVEADIYYIENWSFWFDILILLKTFPAVIRNPGY